MLRVTFWPRIPEWYFRVLVLQKHHKNAWLLRNLGLLQPLKAWTPRSTTEFSTWFQCLETFKISFRLSHFCGQVVSKIDKIQHHWLPKSCVFSSVVFQCNFFHILSIKPAERLVNWNNLMISNFWLLITNRVLDLWLSSVNCQLRTISLCYPWKTTYVLPNIFKGSYSWKVKNSNEPRRVSLSLRPCKESS